MRRHSGVFFSLLLILICIGCTPLKSYRDDQQSGGIRFIEFNESGVAFSQEQFKHGILAAGQVLTDGGTVIVYVHGWHHSAQMSDEHIPYFEKLIASAKQEKGNAIGLYVGWRGDSIDVKEWPILSYALTFWDRKATAHDIGYGGGVTELFQQLSTIRANAPEDARLVIVGHSFGGAIVYSAAEQLLKKQICRDAELAYDSESEACVKIEYQQKESPNGGEFNAVADLMVLLNPAFEAKRLQSLYSLARKHEYPPTLPPRLVMITTTADKATRYAFPLGRWLGTAFRWPPGKESALNRTAIGHYRPFATHQLILRECPLQGLRPMQPDTILRELTTDGTDNTKCFGYYEDNSSFVLTRCDRKGACDEVADGHYLPRGAVGDGLTPLRFPISSIITNKSVLKGHSEIWDDKIAWLLYGLLEMEPSEFPGFMSND